MEKETGGSGTKQVAPYCQHAADAKTMFSASVTGPSGCLEQFSGASI